MCLINFLLVSVNFTFILLLFVLKASSQDCNEFQECNCGTVAEPPGSEIIVKPFKNYNTFERYDDAKEYKHNSQVLYQCKDKNNLLVGNEIRRCDRGKWLGSVPRCAINYINQAEVAFIEIFDHKKISPNSGIHLANRFSDLDALTSSPTRLSDRYPNNCPKWKINENQIWIFKLRHSVDVHYVRIKLYAENLRHHWNNHEIKFEVFLNNLWGIKCNLSNSNTINYEENYDNKDTRNFLTLEFLCESDSNLAKTNRVHMIYVNFAARKNIKIFTLSVCDLRVYYFPKSCGQPDFPALAQVRYSNSFKELEQYEYVCKDNFVLEGLQGNTYIRCGANGKWMDDFPLCVPKFYCKLLKIDSIGNLIKVQYESKIIGAKGEIVIPDGKFAQFSCHNQSNDNNESVYQLEGISSSICRNGQWIGLRPDRKPNCVLKVSVPLTTNSVSTSRKLIRILSGILFVNLISIVCLIIYMLVSSKRKKLGKIDEIQA